MSIFLANTIDIVFLSLITGTGLTITCLKLFKTNALKYDYIIDIIITISLPVLFGNGFHAMTIAILSGIVLSIELFLLKQVWKTPKYGGSLKVYFKEVIKSFQKGLNA